MLSISKVTSQILHKLQNTVKTESYLPAIAAPLVKYGANG